MLPRRYKLLRLLYESLGPSAHTPTCEGVEIIATLEDEQGRTVERRASLLVYPRIMSDPEQFPFVIARALRAMMRGDAGDGQEGKSLITE
ncbi:MAG TPA: hypothetical protein VGL22_19255 [Terracidiphilus sp.]